VIRSTKSCLVAVVIPTFNRKAHLQSVLSQLVDQRLENCQLFFVIVVDGSTDGTIEMLANEFPNVTTVLGDGNWWYTRSMNEGFKKALVLKPDYLLCLNDDVHIETTYVATLLEGAIACQKPSIVGSVTASFDPPHKVLFAGVQHINWLLYRQKNYPALGESYSPQAHPMPIRSVVLPGRGMLIDRRVMDVIGLFDEQLMQYGSDDEYTLRAAKNGFDVWVCWQAVVFSHERLTGADSVYNLPSFGKYFRSFFVRHSPNSLHKLFYIIDRYSPFWARPLARSFVVVGSLYTYLKYWLKNRK
jgi:GT2 family glycosyltransferase